MKRLCLAAALVTVPTPAAASADNGRSYVCDARGGGAVDASGKITEDAYVEAWLKAGLKLSFDENTGMVGFGGRRQKFQVVQKGTEANSAKAIRVYEGSTSTVMEMLQIHTWEESMPFLYTEGRLIYTGNCVAFR